MSEFIPIASMSELREGEGRCIEVRGRRIALFLVDGRPYAIDDTCPHEAGSLSDGKVEGTEVECPWHGACFDLATGKCLALPAQEDVRSYNLRVVGDDVEIEL